jgi:excisionase family DNA binding protein
MAAPRRKAGAFYDPNLLLKKARLRVDEAAVLLQVHSSTIRRWIETEKIPSLRMPGGQLRIRTGALTKYL